MQRPKISPKRLFWLLTAGAFLWAFVGGRTAPPENPQTPPSFMQKTQQFFSSTVGMLLTPAKFVFSGIQGTAASTVDRMTDTHTPGESFTSLHEQIAELKDQIDQRDRQIRLDQEQFLEIKALAPQGLSASEFLPAGVTGYESGPGASLVYIDKGAADGVKRGMVVTACATTVVPPNPSANGRPDPNAKPTTALVPQASILGMVESTSTKTATVRLVTDPRMKIQAYLVRREETGSDLLTPQPCLVEGMGGGELRCNTINVGDTVSQPQPGDLVELADRNWPASVRYMVLGEVTAVGRKDTQLLRYDLAIAPRVNINTVQTVLVVLKK